MRRPAFATTRMSVSIMKGHYMDLINHVDIPGLKKDLESAGCAVPHDFPILLEQHLRVLVHRYRPRGRVWEHKSLKTVPKIQRSFFAEPRSLFGENKNEWFVSWDDDFIRGWRRDLLVPKDYGTKIEAGKVGFEQLKEYMLEKGEAAPNESARVELLENILNEYIR